MKNSRHRFAELTSSVGSGIIGIGLGILFVRFLKEAVAIIILLGILMHGWGMFDMRRMERLTGELSRPAWSGVLYWVCWVSLAVLIIYIGIN